MRLMGTQPARLIPPQGPRRVIAISRPPAQRQGCRRGMAMLRPLAARAVPRDQPEVGLGASGAGAFLVCCFSGHLLALPAAAAAGTDATSPTSPAASAARILSCTYLGARSVPPYNYIINTYSGSGRCSRCSGTSSTRGQSQQMP